MNYQEQISFVSDNLELFESEINIAASLRAQDNDLNDSEFIRLPDNSLLYLS